MKNPGALATSANTNGDKAALEYSGSLAWQIGLTNKKQAKLGDQAYRDRLRIDWFIGAD